MASSSKAVGVSVINGKHVSLDLEQDGSGPTRLAFRGDDDGVIESAIDYKAVIGIDRSTSPNTFDLLYLDVDDSAAKSGPSHAQLKSVKVEDISDDLIAKLQFAKSGQKLHDGSYLQKVTADQDASSRLQVIVSVASGTGQAEQFYHKVLRPLLERHIKREEYDVHLTTSDQSIIELSRRKILPNAQKGREQPIILLSGDGGMIDILNVLYEQPVSQEYNPPSIAILPLGTGNALANSSSSYDDQTYGLRSLFNGGLRPLPTFRATFSPGARYIINEGQDTAELPTFHGVPTAYGAVVCSWGLHAALVADSDTVEYRKHGSERFKMAANEALFPSDGSPSHPYKGTVKILPKEPEHDREWITVGGHEHAYVLATFVSQLEAGFTISPSSTPLDGVLRLIHFGAVSGKDTMEIMTQAYQKGAHVNDPRVSYKDIEGLRIEFHEDDARWRRVCIDGKIIRVEQDGWVEVNVYADPAVSLVTVY